jgi:hypothetical protein
MMHTELFHGKGCEQLFDTLDVIVIVRGILPGDPAHSVTLETSKLLQPGFDLACDDPRDYGEEDNMSEQKWRDGWVETL